MIWINLQVSKQGIKKPWLKYHLLIRSKDQLIHWHKQKQDWGRRLCAQEPYLQGAGQRTDAHLTDPSTDRPTNGIRPKNTTASDRKFMQQADSLPCLGKKFPMMPSDRIENSVRFHNLLIFFNFFLTLFYWNLSALSPLTYSRGGYQIFKVLDLDP